MCAYYCLCICICTVLAYFGCHDAGVYIPFNMTLQYYFTFTICYDSVVRIMYNNCSFLPGFGPSHPACTYAPRHSHRPCTCPASSAPSCHRGNHGPDISYQYSVHISTEPGHHRSSKTQINGRQKQTYELCLVGKLFRSRTLEGAAVTDITYLPSSFSRRSSTSRAPRGRAASARRSSGGRSSSLQVASSPMRRAQTRPQTATDLTTAHCPEFTP